MNTLTTAPLAPLLKRLFAQAKATSPASGYLSTPFAEDVELSMRLD